MRVPGVWCLVGCCLVAPAWADDLDAARAVYEKDLTSAKAAYQAAVDVAFANYRASLAKLQEELTKAGQLDAAIAVRDARARLNQRELELIGRVGHRFDGKEFLHVADDGVLVGFDVGLGQYEGHAFIAAIRPVYGTPGKGYVRGPTFGAQNLRMTPVVAKAGYAVHAATFLSGDQIYGLQLHFARCDGQALDASDRTESEYIGSKGPSGKANSWIGATRPIRGVVGAARDSLDRLGLLVEEAPR